MTVKPLSPEAIFDALLDALGLTPDAWPNVKAEFVERIEHYAQLRIDEYIESALYAHDRKPLLARHAEVQGKLRKLGEGDDS